MASVLKVDEIQSTSAGGVTMPNQPRFTVRGNNANYVTTSPVPFPTVVIDNASGWNTGTNRYVVQKAGDYLFAVRMGICRVTSNDGYSYPNLKLNGTSVAYSYIQMSSATSFVNGIITTILTCAVNDYVEVAFHASGGDYYNGSQESSFSGHMLG